MFHAKRTCLLVLTIRDEHSAACRHTRVKQCVPSRDSRDPREKKDSCEDMTRIILVHANLAKDAKSKSEERLWQRKSHEDCIVYTRSWRLCRMFIAGVYTQAIARVPSWDSRDSREKKDSCEDMTRIILVHANLAKDAKSKSEERLWQRKSHEDCIVYTRSWRLCRMFIAGVYTQAIARVPSWDSRDSRE